MAASLPGSRPGSPDNIFPDFRISGVVLQPINLLTCGNAKIDSNDCLAKGWLISYQGILIGARLGFPGYVPPPAGHRHRKPR